MSKTIYFIVEGKLDIKVIQAIFRAKNLKVKLDIRHSSASKPNLAHLAEQIEELIQAVLAVRTPGDCVVVLHDADLLSRPYGREDYDRITRICGKYSAEILYLMAHDELEAWLLADGGLSKWLNESPRNHDKTKQPSKMFDNWLDKSGKPKFTLLSVDRVLRYLDGRGDNYSPSMREVFLRLREKDCF